jgi:hypothetical protein
MFPHHCMKIEVFARCTVKSVTSEISGIAAAAAATPTLQSTGRSLELLNSLGSSLHLSLLRHVSCKHSFSQHPVCGNAGFAMTSQELMMAKVCKHVVKVNFTVKTSANHKQTCAHKHNNNYHYSCNLSSCLLHPTRLGSTIIMVSSLLSALGERSHGDLHD